MDLYHTTDFQGISMLSPDLNAMRTLLESLDSEDALASEHPDVSLTHDPSGWTISVYPSGIVTLENLDTPDAPPRVLKETSRDNVLQLWTALSKGRLESIMAQPWIDE